MDTREHNSIVLALTSSALALPAYHPARGDAPPEYGELGLRYSSYREDDISSRHSFDGRSERMEVDVTQLHLFAPVAEDWALALDVAWEHMSGASPWFVGASADGAPQVIMSGASIRDNRTEVSVTTRYYYARGNAGFNYTHSEEDDYESDAIAIDGSLNSRDGLTTYSAALSVSDDHLEPTQGSTATSTLKADKDIRSAWLGVTRIVSKRAIVRFGLSYTYRDGFLSDPYKALDRRPDTRRERALSAGYRQFLLRPNAAAHIDYRYFHDDWGVRSHTLDLAWHQNLGARTRLVPFLRYYTQGEADFFSNQASIQDRYFADDHRLSAFGAFSLGLRVRYDIDDWSLSLAGERYRSDSSWGVYSGEESPGLVDAWRFSLGLDYVFR